MSRSDTTVDRRAVLKRLGAAGAAGTALGAASGSGAAEGSTTGRVRRLPLDRIDVEAVFRELAGELLVELSDAGLIEAPSVAALETDIEASHFGRRDRGTFGLYFSGGVRDGSLITTTARTDEGRVTLSVEPEHELAYALYEPADEDATLLYAPGHGPERVDVGRSSACPSCTCYPDFPCNNDYGGPRLKVCWNRSTGGLPCVRVTTCC